MPRSEAREAIIGALRIALIVWLWQLFVFYILPLVLRGLMDAR